MNNSVFQGQRPQHEKHRTQNWVNNSDVLPLSRMKFKTFPLNSLPKFKSSSLFGPMIFCGYTGWGAFAGDVNPFIEWSTFLYSRFCTICCFKITGRPVPWDCVHSGTWIMDGVDESVEWYGSGSADDESGDINIIQNLELPIIFLCFQGFLFHLTFMLAQGQGHRTFTVAENTHTHEE